ncbi:GntR family transcriptional regulator [Mycobacterium marinum]|uniref:GntR family transcriptional regulator n=1 Tax=Mycobacterium marinum TaxID=1781 RepID=UPI002358B4FA|nr:GntR family transcriptional regulator [Mycobacterium marinum]WCS20573.1 GntR family transcriptional regulator [Mycobacterium marinum]
MTSDEDSPLHDLTDADLRVTRGSVPASVQLAELLRTQILERALSPGSRLPTEQELIARSGVSRSTVRAAVGILEDEGWLVRRQGLGTFVAEPVKQDLESGVRTITEVLLSRGVTPRVEVLSHAVVAAPQSVGAALGRSEVLRIQRRYSESDQPLAIVTCYLPADLPHDAVEPLLCATSATATTYTMWEQRLGVRISSATHEIQAAGASPEIAAALGLSEGAPVLVLRRTSYTDGDKPLEVVLFHHRPERYEFCVTLPRTMPGQRAGMTER